MKTRQIISGFVAVVLIGGAAVTSAGAARWSLTHAAIPVGLTLADLKVDVNKLPFDDYEDMSLVFFKR